MFRESFDPAISLPTLHMYRAHPIKQRRITPSMIEFTAKRETPQSHGEAEATLLVVKAGQAVHPT